ncbi:hypothetical protein ACGF1Z_01060 [Streptomyces sp. NPDC048018]|uniref:hypothetical protein n=1 Tax=Streptomyces sp. NPDC048018 TaxID=3365499 RepID=UPI0037110587
MSHRDEPRDRTGLAERIESLRDRLTELAEGVPDPERTGACHSSAGDAPSDYEGPLREERKPPEPPTTDDDSTEE